MAESRLFDVRERQVRDRVLKRLREHDSTAWEECRSLEAALRDLAGAFARYPSILDQRTLGGDVYSMETLIDVVYRDGVDHIVLLPTRVAVGRSLVVARSNFFAYLLKVCDETAALAEYREELRRAWELGIFSLLVEDVYQMIIGRASCYPAAVRRGAAIDLIHLWEYRYDRRISEYAPIVIDLWRARSRVVPVFGSMIGTRELLRLSSGLSDRWHDFISEHGDDREFIQALEELIFGLSWEEIVLLRRRMSEEDRTTIDRTEVPLLLGSGNAIDAASENDPRDMYRFFQRRRQLADERALKAEFAGGSADPGPWRTVEELLLAYLIGERLEVSARAH